MRTCAKEMKTLPIMIQYGEGWDPEGYSNQVPSINFLRSRKNPYVAKNSQYKDLVDVTCFLEEMNRNAARLGLRSSFFDSPHGLVNFRNMSTALDLSKLGAISIKEPIIAQIVSTRHYQVLKSKKTNQNKKSYRWENTHRMLEQK